MVGDTESVVLMTDPMDHDGAKVFIRLRLPGSIISWQIERHVGVGSDSRLTRDILARSIEFDAMQLVDKAYEELACTNEAT